MFECKIIADSICNTRLTTVEIRYPRFVHSEVLTHRDRARNAGSSRAIPWPVMMDAILGEPVIPIYWGKNQKGMQTGEEIDLPNRIKAEEIWLAARDSAVKAAQALHDLGVHKSLCNRITEPWMWITVVMSATEWSNFFNQRCHPDAEIHFQKIAGMIRDSLVDSVPDVLKEGEWHTPYIQQDDDIISDYFMCRVSAARCARVSYVQHGEKAKSIEKDLKLTEDLIAGSGNLGHRSPFEHIAQAKKADYRSGPFKGWHQFRKDLWIE